MGRNSKWIEAHADRAHRGRRARALDARLERVWHYLGQSVKDSQDETENVHQLRVFVRRTTAALEIFDAWLPRGRGRWVRKQVKRVRKAAGPARDLDVLAMSWSEHTQALPEGAAAILIDEARRARREAQQPIEKILDKLTEKHFERRVTRFVKRVAARGWQSPSSERFGCLARKALGALAVRYLAAAPDERADVESLHAFRIEGKRVRYAMEVFAGAFDAPFRDELYPLVVDLQDRLGAINDHVTAAQYLESWRAVADCCDKRTAFEQGIVHQRAALESSRQEFLAWWTADRQRDLAARFGQFVTHRRLPKSKGGPSLSGRSATARFAGISRRCHTSRAA